MPVFSRSIVIRAPVQALYDFHLDTNNARLIQPPGMPVLEVHVPPKIKVGAEIKLVVGVLGIFRLTWRVKWAELTPPGGHPFQARLVDESLQGPFPTLRHEHIFRDEGVGTRMTDRLTFTPPLGWLGWVLLPGIYSQLHLVFWWRQRRTRLLLESRSSS